jgi:hypothetical protein
MALALPGAIASSRVADAALIDLGVLAQCDAEETLCPGDDLEPREQIGIVAATRSLRRPGEGNSDASIRPPGKAPRLT